MPGTPAVLLTIVGIVMVYYTLSEWGVVGRKEGDGSRWRGYS